MRLARGDRAPALSWGWLVLCTLPRADSAGDHGLGFTTTCLPLPGEVTTVGPPAGTGSAAAPLLPLPPPPPPTRSDDGVVAMGVDDGLGATLATAFRMRTEDSTAVMPARSCGPVHIHTHSHTPVNKQESRQRGTNILNGRREGRRFGNDGPFSGR